MDVPHIVGNDVTGTRHFYDFLSGDHDRLTVKFVGCYHGHAGGSTPG